MNRNHQITSLRSDVIIDTDRVSLAIESFQNNVLRPILKFQHELLVDYFISHSAYQLLPANVQERAAVLQITLIKMWPYATYTLVLWLDYLPMRNWRFTNFINPN